MKEKVEIVKKFINFKYKLNFRSEEALRIYQQLMIKKHLNYITSNSKYYKSLNLSDECNLNDFPIVNKKIMMDNFDDMNTVGINKEEAFRLALKSEEIRGFEDKLNNITIGLSSGTSGQRGVFLVSDEERTLWAGAIISKLLPLNMILGCKIAFFMRANSNLYETVKSNLLKFKFYDMYLDINNHIEDLNNFKPTVVIAPPSVLLELSEAKDKKSLNINPKKIISIAEVLEKKDKNTIAQSFGLIINEVYQCTEGFLGATCKEGNMHLNEDAIFIEKEWIDDKRFIPIITDFKRKSQPIIRYRLNDVLVINKEKCPCGSMHLRLDAIEGREDDIFIFKSEFHNNYKKIYSDFIRRCFLFVDEVKNYRVIQVDLENIIVELDYLNNQIEEKIKKEFKKLSSEQGFKMPKIDFDGYKCDNKKKLKRVERLQFSLMK